MAARKQGAAWPPAELDALTSELERGELRPFHVLRGEERWFRARMGERICEAARARSFEVCRHDSADPDFTPARLVDDLLGGALFASARCIWLENASSVLTASGKRYARGVADALAQRAASGVEGCVVLSGSGLADTNATVKKLLAAGGRAWSCRKLYDSPSAWKPDPADVELVRWLAGRARARGLRLAPEAAVYVCQATGNDLFALEGQLDKLATRGAEGLRELVPWQAGSAPWEIADQMLRGDARAAVPALEAYFREGFQGKEGARETKLPVLLVLLFGQLTAKARESSSAAALLEAGARPEDAAAAAGKRGGPAAKAQEARTALRSSAEWDRILREIAALELRSRSGARVDGNDFALLALRWGLRAARGARG